MKLRLSGGTAGARKDVRDIPLRVAAQLFECVQTYATPLAICAAWAILNEAFLRGRAYIPWDSTSEFYPTAHFVIQSVRAGNAPWWNPLVFGGQPLFGDPQSLIFTPQILVGVLAGSLFNQRIFDLTSVFLELCGGLALARYTRSHAGTRTLPILGAIVFMAGGVATSRLQHVPQIISYSLLPMQLLAIRFLCDRPSAARIMLLSLLLWAGLVNPNQVTFLSVFALAPFAALHVLESCRWWRSAFAVLAACGCALILCSPLLSAMREFASISMRPSLALAQSRDASMPLFDAASIFLPGLFGVSWPAGGLWPPTDATQDYLYIGMIPAGLTAAALLGAGATSLRIALCLASAGVWFIFAMGLNTPLYPWLFHHLPGLSAFRRPADGTYLLNLSLALLVGSFSVRTTRRGVPPAVQAGAGLLLCAALAIVMARLADYASSVGHGTGLRHVLLAAAWRAALLASVGVTFWRVRPSRLAWLAAPVAVVFTIGDVGLAGRASGLFIQPVKASALAQAFGRHGMTARSTNPLAQAVNFLEQHGAGGPNPRFRVEILGGDLGGDQPLAFGLMSTQGYNPIRLRAYDDIIGGQDLQNEAKLFRPHAPSYDSADYRRLSLRYVAMHHWILAHPSAFGAAGASMSRIHDVFAASAWAKQLDAPGAYEIWELANAMPRAVVVLTDGSQAPCNLDEFTPSEVAVTCHAPAAGRLVLGDTTAPGWRACVDGQPAEISAFNGLFRSVPVPADSHTVFRYYPVPFLRFLAACN